MPTIYGAVDLVKNELRNAVIQNLGTAPASPVKGQIYFDSTGNVLYWWNGTQWVAAQGGAGAVPSDAVSTQAIGDAAAPGASALYSRGDHKHGMPAFGVISAETAFGSAKADGAAVTIARSDHLHGNPAHDAAAHANVPWSSFLPSTANMNAGGYNITNLYSPLNPTDAATRAYVDNAINGLAWKDAARAATTANIALTNGQTIDGVVLANGDRVLVKNQTTASANGLYQVSTAGAWIRATDADAAAEVEGMAVFINEGTANADTAWVCTANAPITLGTTDLPFAQFGAGATYVGGNGLTLTGNVFDVGAGSGILVAADTVSVDPAVVVRKYAASLLGNASPEVVTHNLGTRDVQVSVHAANSPWSSVEVDWDATSVNTVTVRYNPSLVAGYRIAIFG